ncbi:hypothetical protein ACFPOI_35940 [Nonomuraea angiospora]|uniref:Tellurite resistance protein TehA-like permease n=1 Tax=Nonomuraea angiospora TaxID=46172 RepID=A0ABR9M8S0_9ACTN|nr:hypothetical protein [Nonomuraea angiospora]MBE1589313.1 tellurite resistance protein TehA-like permease [Nonomuraea angiospora]
MNTRTVQRQVGITPNMFGISYGLAGLATCWGYAAMLGVVPGLVADVLFIVTAVVWLVPHALTAGRWLFRLMFRPRLPAPLLPTLAIEIAPPALAGLAYLVITHDRFDAVALVFGGFTALAVIVQLRLIPVYRRLAFGPAFWSFAFPYAAVATFALHWIKYGRPVGYTVWAWVVLLAITAFIAVLVAKTTAALARRRFLPQLQ